MTDSQKNIDFKDIVNRAIQVYKRAFSFYTISTKHMSKRQKLKRLRLLNLFPNVNQVIKNYNNIHELTYEEYLHSLFNKRNHKQRYKKDNKNIERLNKDVQLIYNTYFNNKSNQKGGSVAVSSTIEVGSEQHDPDTHNIEINEGEKKQIEAHIKTTWMDNMQKITIQSLLTLKDSQDLYTYLTAGGGRDLYTFYGKLSEGVSDKLAEIFPEDAELSDYTNSEKALQRISKLLTLYSEFEDLSKTFVANVIQLKQKGIKNPFLAIVDTLKVAITSLLDLKSTISNTVNGVTDIFNVVVLIIQAVVTATGGGAPFTASGLITAIGAEAGDIVSIGNVLIDICAPFFIFFLYITMGQDELAAETILNSHQAFYELPINILYSIMSIMSQIINMKHLCDIELLYGDNTSVEPSSQLHKNKLDRISTLVEDMIAQLKQGGAINVTFEQSDIKVYENVKVIIINSILCQMIEVFTLEGTCMLLHLNIQDLVIKAWNIIVELSKEASTKVDQGLAAYNDNGLVTGLKLIFGREMVDKWMLSLANIPAINDTLQKEINPITQPGVLDLAATWFTDTFQQTLNSP